MAALRRRLLLSAAFMLSVAACGELRANVATPELFGVTTSAAPAVTSTSDEVASFAGSASLAASAMTTPTVPEPAPRAAVAQAELTVGGRVHAARRSARPPWSKHATVDAPVSQPCTVSSTLRLGTESEEVACLERALAIGGYLRGATDRRFDAKTDEAVQLYQYVAGLPVDGVADTNTARHLGLGAPIRAATLIDAACPRTGHAALVDRALQQGWLCSDGLTVREFPLTSAHTQPDPGVYPVFAKDLESSSTLTGRFSRMTHFVAFTRGKYQNARIAFHSVPTYSDGSFIQPLDSVGTARMKGESSGCLRVLPVDATAIWAWLNVGDPVVVLT